MSPVRSMLSLLRGDLCRFDQVTLPIKASSTAFMDALVHEESRSTLGDRKRQDEGKCEGRKTRCGSSGPRSSRRRSAFTWGEPKDRRTVAAFDKIVGELAALGHLNERGAPNSAKSVRAMLAQ